MASQSPSAILRKLSKSSDTDKAGPNQRTQTDREGDDKDDEKFSSKKNKRNSLTDFISKNKKKSWK